MTASVTGARLDLLALTADDLALLGNRGLVKRATRELEAGEPTLVSLLEDAEGNVTASWGDDVSCSLPAGVVLSDASCSCPAVSLCRHLIRSVLAYQEYARGREGRSPAARRSGATHIAAAEPGPVGPWDPGGISDEELSKHLGGKAAFNRARKALEQGVLAELVRSAKPTARFHGLGFTLRFMVPGDVRYVSCDCGDRSPCRHAALAVWAFRELDADRSAGYVSLQQKTAPPPLPLLDELEAAMAELLRVGAAGGARRLKDRLRRLEREARAQGLAWPAEICADLALQQERYLAHDARFDPDLLVELVGEQLIRARAIRSDTGAVPQLLIRGLPGDRESRTGKARFIGLGCGARFRRGGVELTVYLQDADSGSIVALQREFPDPPDESDEEPGQLSRLARRPVVQGVTLASLGSGQLLLQNAKRSAGGRLAIGRTRSSFSPQTYAWNALRPPALAEGFAEVASRLAGLPPASLRPRRVAEDFHVCPVARVAEARFDDTTQCVEAVLLDAQGDHAYLVHPYTGRGAAGSEALLAALEGEAPVRYAAGPVHLGPRGLELYPVSLVVEARKGQRRLVQPWVDGDAGEVGAQGDSAKARAGEPPEEAPDPVDDYPAQLAGQLAELAVTGLEHADPRAASAWRDLSRRGEAMGFDHLVAPVSRLAEALEQRQHTTRWDPTAAERAALSLSLLVRLAAEVGAGA
jgi:hypothetical protein